ncbi:MAG: hypothetical protein JL50_16375 [Peptococcaceae bacterium BICA1-7]|nr:MAG: hypothetical protein JL50_16375 [Peptococcaceae bacterium BICA1-7]HBV96632.1 hypothetical protein [Desulfotomaculum sp.]
MMWPRWYVLNRKLLLPVAGAAFAIIILLWAAASLIGGGLSERELFDRSLANTIGCSGYHFSVEVKQAGRDTISMVEGARVKPNKVHIKGAMQKSSMEFIQIDDTTYMKDPWSNRWFTLKGNSVTQSELFLTEFNPLGLYNFKDVPIIKRTGSEKINGINTDILELSPNVANPLLDQKYTDYKFRVWVDPKLKYIMRGVMQAYLPGGAEGLVVDMRFWGFNEKIEIVPPLESDLEIKTEIN